MLHREVETGLPVIQGVDSHDTWMIEPREDSRLLLEACHSVFEEQQNDTDLVLGLPVRLGLGFGLPTPDMPLPNERCCHWGGWGGSLAIVDMENRISFSYVMNEMRESADGDPRALDLLMALYTALRG